MTISVKVFSAVLLLFFLFAAPNSAENKTPMIRSGNQSCPVSYPNEYSLLFENCNPQYNSENYYSTGLTHLSYIYLGFSVLYLIFLGVWISICLKIRQPYRRIHFLMAGLIVMKVISLILAADERYYEKIIGSRGFPDLLIFANQIIGAVRLLVVILLLFIGLPLVKPCLQVIDETVLTIMIPLRILAEVVSIIIGEKGVKNGSIWNEMIAVVYIINPFFMMIPYTCSILSSMIGARVSAKLESVRTFYLIVTLYLMAMRVFTVARINSNFKLTAIDGYEYLLKSNAALEVNSLIFYLVTFYLFKKYFDRME